MSTLNPHFDNYNDLIFKNKLKRRGFTGSANSQRQPLSMNYIND
jgi:hypothetical protein